jgi:hypothetical protein
MKRLLWSGLIACCVIGLALIIEHNAARGRFARSFSSYGSGPEGTRGLFLMLGELGFRTARWSQDLARMPERATLVALGSCEDAALRPLSRYEREDLQAWVERGGLLIVAGARNYLPSALGVGFEDDRRCKLRAGEASVLPRTSPKRRAVEPEDAAGKTPDEVLALLTELADGQLSAAEDIEKTELLGVPLGSALKGLAFVPFRKPAQLMSDPGLAFESLLVSSESATQLRPLALTYVRGKGRVIVLSSANMLQNAELAANEGATLFVRLLRAYAPSDLLIFDEYHLGLGERRSLMQYMRQLGMLPLFAQLVLIAGVALWRAGARMGEARSADSSALQPEAAAFAIALGRLYARVGDQRAALRLIARGALARVAQHYARSNLPAEALARELAARGVTVAAESVRQIAAIGSQPGAEPLVASVARIDAACEAALYPRGDGSIGPRRTHNT